MCFIRLKHLSASKKIGTLRGICIELTPAKISLLCSNSCPNFKYIGGAVPFYTLTRTNITTLHQEIPIEKLTQTFQDALLVIRQLGLHYIWIDSLCIIQDDEEDWGREAVLMSQVYGNATVNISATKAENGSFGLFTSRSVPLVDRHFVQGKNTRNLFELEDPKVLNRCLHEAPLSQRGWCFQEQFLATRTLHFTAEQLFCKCQCGIVCETFPTSHYFKLDPFSENTISRSHQFDDREDPWPKLVSRYSRTQLTYSKDKLIAFSGIARYFQNNSGDQYLAGLWHQNIGHHLCWKVECEQRRPGRSRGATYRAPTFSWASIDQPISWDSTLSGVFAANRRIAPLVSILNVSVVPLGTDLLGGIKDASLKLQTGPIISCLSLAQFLPAKSSPSNPADLESGIGIPLQGNYWVEFDEEDDNRRELDNIWYLPIVGSGCYMKNSLDKIEHMIYGLVVTQSSAYDRGHYVRLGFLRVELDDEDYEKLMQLLLQDPRSLMGESLYQEVLATNENGIPQYAITLG